MKNALRPLCRTTGFILLCSFLAGAIGMALRLASFPAAKFFSLGLGSVFFTVMTGAVPQAMAAGGLSGVLLIVFSGTAWRKTRSVIVTLLASGAALAVCAAILHAAYLIFVHQFGSVVAFGGWWSTMAQLIWPSLIHGPSSMQLTLLGYLSLLYLLMILLGYGACRLTLFLLRSRHAKRGEGGLRFRAADNVIKKLPLAGASAFFLLVIVTLVPLGPKARPGSPNVVLISIDALRADHVGAYGYPRGTTPGLDSLARESVVFDDVFSSGNWTLPSHATMLSGIDPVLHGAVDNRRRIDNRVLLLSEWFKGHGYHTSALVSSLFLSPAYGFGAGFDHYDFWMFEQNAGELVDRADALAGKWKEPFFFFFHLLDPHWPYAPPESYRVFGSSKNLPWPDPKDYNKFLEWIDRSTESERAAARDLYDAEIFYTDSQLSRFFDELKRLGLWERTIILVTSDHGEELYDHEYWGHGHALYQEVMRVPMMIRPRPADGIAPGRVSALAGLIDVAPTLADLAGIPLTYPVEGRSLLCHLRGMCGEIPPTPYVARDIVLGVSRSERFAVRLTGNPFKYVTAAAPRKMGGRMMDRPEQLFDLASDPGEKINLIDKDPEAASRMRTILQQWRLQRPDAVTGHVVLTREMKERLRSLGYLSQ